ncbi:MAG: hypothetical protein IKT89_02220, partial [Clostridia bacterium]|nr:hypothetical protein [Clostridia bacterium]
KGLLNMNKEQQILHYMKSLQISRAEAEQLWEDDKEDFIGEEGEEMTQKAKQVKRYEQADKPKEKKKREVKLDEDKVQIIDTLYTFTLNSELPIRNLFIKNVQKEITFEMNGCEYSLNLVKHRPPKK